jgi:hypothetical protein
MGGTAVGRSGRPSPPATLQGKKIHREDAKSARASDIGTILLCRVEDMPRALSALEMVDGEHCTLILSRSSLSVAANESKSQVRAGCAKFGEKPL